MNRGSIATGLGTLIVLSLVAGAAPGMPVGPSLLDEATSLLAAGAYGEGMRSLATAQDLTLPAAPAVADGADALVALSNGHLDRAGADAILAQVDAPMLAGVETMLVGIAQADLLVQGELARFPGLTADDLWVGGSWAGLAFGDAEAEPYVPLEQRVPAGLDVAPFVAAEAILLDAVERALPSLVAPSAHPCSPVNEKPYLMVCQGGSSTYDSTDNAILIVDVDGHDTYDNAQGTPFSGLGVPVLPQVIVDVQGNDRYERSASAATGTASVVAQGAGVLGVGGIVDVLGNDRYAAHAGYTPTDEPVVASVVAQGAGSLGAGFLVDLGGTDCVEATATGHGNPATVTAQGAGAVGAGFAALLGSFGGVRDCPSGPFANARGDPRVVDETTTVFGTGVVTAQGAAFTGAGALVGGTAGSTYTAVASGGAGSSQAQGAARAGAGALVDLGGTDAYLSSATVFVNPSLNLEGFFSSVTTQVTVNMGDTIAIGQGAGFFAGAGALADVGSAKDTYTTSASTTVNAFSRSATTFSGGTAVSTVRVTVGRVLAMGHGGAETGAALHADGGGTGAITSADDTRTVRASLVATSKAVAAGGASRTATAETTTGNSDAQGQGLGVTGAGVLVDALGNDVYTLDAALTASADAVASGGSETETLNPGTARARGQAQGLTGAGGLVDVVGQDTYTRTGGTAATNEACYTNSPPGQDTNIGVGVDVVSSIGPAVPGSCTTVPPPN